MEPGWDDRWAAKPNPCLGLVQVEVMVTDHAAASGSLDLEAEVRAPQVAPAEGIEIAIVDVVGFAVWLTAPVSARAAGRRRRARLRDRLQEATPCRARGRPARRAARATASVPSPSRRGRRPRGPSPGWSRARAGGSSRKAGGGGLAAGSAPGRALAHEVKARIATKALFRQGNFTAASASSLHRSRAFRRAARLRGAGAAAG